MKSRLFIFPLLLLLVQTAWAQPSRYQTQNVIRIAPGDTLYRNVMLSGESVEISGFLDNDLFAASRNFSMSGKTKDDAFVAAQILSVTGEVDDMLMAAGETVFIDGVVAGDLFVAGQEVVIGEHASIGGNAFIGGQSVTIEGGVIEGMLRIGGEQVRLNGMVNEATEIYSNDVTFGEAYQSIYGTTITSTETLYRENLGVIPPDLVLKTEDGNVAEMIFAQIGFYISVLLTGLILLWVFHNTAVDMTKYATERFWKNTGWGLLAFIGIPLSIVILAVLVITIPISILLGLAYLIALFISYLLVATALGVMSIVYVKGETTRSSYYYGLALGLIYIAILTNIPFIGGILNMLLLFFGLGSLTLYIWELHRSRSAGSV
jgi:cytoskeletal protein CcmA (bactofilin family)